MKPQLPMPRPGAALLALLLCLSGALGAHEVDQLRIEAGIDLFPSFLAADLDIADKADDDGRLTLLLVYRDAAAEAERLAGVLRRIGKIRNLPVRVRLSHHSVLEDAGDQRVAGIYLVEHVDKADFASVLAFSRRARALLISPHDGDVELGASGGIHVSDRLLPYVNMRSVQESGIRLKPFFLRIAEKYAD